MDTALILGAGLMGLAGTPHCAAMCGAPCAAVTQRCGSQARHGLLAGFTLGVAIGDSVKVIIRDKELAAKVLKPCFARNGKSMI